MIAVVLSSIVLTSVWMSFDYDLTQRKHGRTHYTYLQIYIATHKREAVGYWVRCWKWP